MGASQTPSREVHCDTLLYKGLYKAPKRGGFAKPLGAFYTHTYICTFQSLPTDMGVLCDGGFAKPLYQRSSLWGIHKVPLKKGFHYGGSTKPLYRRRLCYGGFASPPVERVLLWMLHEAPV